MENEALEFVGLIMEYSLGESKNNMDTLMQSNVRSSFIHGFEHGIREGMKRQAVETRQNLGIYQKEPTFFEAEFYLQELIEEDEYPYSLLKEK